MKENTLLYPKTPISPVAHLISCSMQPTANMINPCTIRSHHHWCGNAKHAKKSWRRCHSKSIEHSRRQGYHISISYYSILSIWFHLQSGVMWYDAMECKNETKCQEYHKKREATLQRLQSMQQKKLGYCSGRESFFHRLWHSQIYGGSEPTANDQPVSTNQQSAWTSETQMATQACKKKKKLTSNQIKSNQIKHHLRIICRWVMIEEMVAGVAPPFFNLSAKSS